MKKVIFFATAIAFMLLTSCSTSKQVTIPLSRSVELDDTYTIIWNSQHVPSTPPVRVSGS